MSELRDAIELIERATELIDEREPTSPLDLCALWVDLSRAVDGLQTMCRTVRYDASDALTALLDGTGRDVIETPSGWVKLGREYAPQRWRGWELCDAIAVDHVDITTGEIVRAVPVDRLRTVLPGCSSSDLVSSKWRADVGRYVPLDRFREQTPWKERRPQIETGGGRL
jgi:hypothetical protein